VFWPTSERADRIADTPDLSTTYCPECDPIQDPKKIVRPYPCEKHNAPPSGDMDALVEPTYLGGTSESEGIVNRRMADLLRGETNETEAADLQTERET
jgi:hypothetical protein